MSLIPERYANYETKCTIGVVNFTSIRGDKSATLEKIEANIREAGAQGIDILVFPEEALVGLGGCDICRNGADHCDYHHDLAETVSSLQQKGVSVARLEDSSDCFAFQDLDGNWFQLVDPAEQ